jgi:hypothetical protein
MSRPKPLNMELYNKVKQEASEKFKAPTGAYRSMWLSREYVKRGGAYDKPKPKHTKLTDWRKEKWVDLNQPKAGGGFEKCGHKNTQNDKYPLCRPSKRVNKDTPKTYQSISKDRIDEVNKEKQEVKSEGNIRF